MNSLKFNISRRKFMTLAGASALGLLVKPQLSLAGLENPRRRLVVLEMNGGNDGLNTVIPYGQGAYYDLRPNLAIPEHAVLPINGQLGFHPALSQLQQLYRQGQVAVVQGVGHPQPELSHFEMAEYWRSGHPKGMNFTGQTGWLGRMLDVLAQSEEGLSGLSLASTISPALFNKSALIAAIYDAIGNQPYIPWQYQALYWPLLDGLAAANSGDSMLTAAAKKGIRHSRLAFDLLPQLLPGKIAYPETETARLLDLAARALAASTDIQVLHIAMPLEFDHHIYQIPKHQASLSELDSALGAFINDLGERNLLDQTLIMMVSEFGRRVAENYSAGTDHGTANNVFLLGGQIQGGLYGEQPSLTNLDDNGNLKAGLSYLDVLATVSQGWMGVNAGQILPGGTVLSLFS